MYIPGFNAAHFLEEVLPAVKLLTRLPEELLVADDDASSDDTRQVILKHARNAPFPMRRISAGTRTGLARARNVALAETRTEFIASLDADCVPEPDWLEKLMDRMEEGVSGAGGRLVEGYRHSAPDLWRAVHAGQSWGDRPIVNPPFLFGHGNVFATEALRAVGGYDESLSRAGEDHDICVRLRAAGHTLVYEPKARCRHLRRDTFRSILDTSFVYSQWSARRGARNALGRIYSHLVRGAGLVLRDLVRFRFRLLAISLAYAPWMVYRELRLRRQDGWRSGY